MIEVRSVTKYYGNKKAVDHVDVMIPEGCLFGLVGTNGAGKSTLLRMITGMMKPTEGTVLVEGTDIYDRPEGKREIFYIPDDAYFFAGATPGEMMDFYATYYEGFQKAKYEDLLGKFHLTAKMRISALSKGMKKLVSILLGIAANTKYLICDETFDGLDPVMRQAVKSLFIREMDERGLTLIIASHNLRELEDICEYVGLLHQGGIILQSDLEHIKNSIHKVQCVIKDEEKLLEVRQKLQPILSENRGSLYMMTVRGEREDVLDYLEQANLVFYELLPLSLEEIFISETEVKGYDVKELLG